MKKNNILIAAFAVLAAVSAVKGEEIKVEGKESGILFAQLVGQTGGLSAASRPVGMMPARPAPEFSPRQVSNMDKSIAKAIKYAGETMKNPGLKANLECLRLSATQEEKFAFVHAAPGSAYKFPEACSVKQTKDWVDDLLTWVCEAVWVPICKETCSLGVEDGETIVLCIEDCNDQLVEACSWV